MKNNTLQRWFGFNERYEHVHGAPKADCEESTFPKPPPLANDEKPPPAEGTIVSTGFGATTAGLVPNTEGAPNELPNEEVLPKTGFDPGTEV